MTNTNKRTTTTAVNIAQDWWTNDTRVPLLNRGVGFPSPSIFSFASVSVRVSVLASVCQCASGGFACTVDTGCVVFFRAAVCASGSSLAGLCVALAATPRGYFVTFMDPTRQTRTPAREEKKRRGWPPKQISPIKAHVQAQQAGTRPVHQHFLLCFGRFLASFVSAEQASERGAHRGAPRRRRDRMEKKNSLEGNIGDLARQQSVETSFHNSEIRRASPPTRATVVDATTLASG